MKLLFIFFLAASSFTASFAFADLTCSNPDQSLSYSRQTSNDGPYNDLVKVTYNGQTAESSDINDHRVIVFFFDGSTLEETPVGNGTMKIYSARASGRLESTEGNSFAFDNEWVVCKQVKYPAPE